MTPNENSLIAALVLSGIWIFVVLGWVISICRENKHNLKEATDAHKAEQTTIDKDELSSLPDLDDIDWAGLGIQRSEQPFVYMHPWRN